MSEDWEYVEGSCPKCAHESLHGKPCDNLNCEDGCIDESEDDPINFMPGERYSICTECKGYGFIVWCPNCGADLTGMHDFE